MKLFAKFLIAAAFIAVLLPFTVLKGTDGKTLMSLPTPSMPSLSLDSLPDLPDFGEKNSSASRSSGGEDLFYKWHDKQGNVQFTSEPPPNGVEYTVKGYDPNANVIQAVDTSILQPKIVKSSQSSSRPTNSADAIGNPYSPERVKKLFDDANNIEKILNQRLKDQEAAIN